MATREIALVILACAFSAEFRLNLVFEQEPVEAQLGRFIKTIEMRKQEYIPCRAAYVKSMPLRSAKQWYRITWFGGDMYVSEFGNTNPSIEQPDFGGRYTDLMLGNAFYFASISRGGKPEIEDKFILRKIERKDGSRFPQALHPVMDSMRVVNIFDDFGEMLRSGQFACSVSQGILTAKWQSQDREKDVSIELQFDENRARCIRQLIKYPNSETIEYIFKYTGDEVVPSGATYLGSANGVNYKFEFEVKEIDKGHGNSDACFLRFYGFPEPNFGKPQRISRSTFIFIGLGLMVCAVWFLARHHRSH
ncbi:MAG: hypothetical protein ACKO81_05410 [Planctomycetota bacterium]